MRNSPSVCAKDHDRRKAYNGVTEYVGRPVDLTKLRNHAAIAKAHDRRLNSIWFGDGYSIKARTYSAAEQSLRAWAN